MKASAQPRDQGRFAGAERIDIEGVPCLPSTVGKMLLNDPRHRPIFAVWLDPGVRDMIGYLAVLTVDPSLPDAVLVCGLGQPSVRVRLARRPRHQGGTLALWRCPQCGRLATGMFLFGRGSDGVLRLGVACSRCQGLCYRSRSAPVTRTAVLRSLLKLEPGARIPRAPLIPDVIVVDPKSLSRRFRNLSVVDGPIEGNPAAVLGVTV